MLQTKRSHVHCVTNWYENLTVVGITTNRCAFISPQIIIFKAWSRLPNKDQKGLNKARNPSYNLPECLSQESFSWIRKFPTGSDHFKCINSLLLLHRVLGCISKTKRHWNSTKFQTDFMVWSFPHLPLSIWQSDVDWTKMVPCIFEENGAIVK